MAIVSARGECMHPRSASFTLGSFLCGISTDIHWLVACRVLQGGGGRDDAPRRTAHHGPKLCQIELIAAMSFVAMPGLIGPMLGPLLGGLIIGYFHWSVIFFVNIPIGLCGLVLAYRHCPITREAQSFRSTSSGWCCSAPVFHCCPTCSKYSVKTDLSGREMLGLLAMSAHCSGPMDSIRRAPRILVAAESGANSQFPRRGDRQSVHSIGDRRNSLSLAASLPSRLGLFQPIQSGLLILPQALAAMSLKLTMPPILKRFGFPPRIDRQHRPPGLDDFSVLDHRFRHAGMDDRADGVHVRILTSLQYTSMNTLAYADVNDREASAASTSRAPSSKWRSASAWPPPRSPPTYSSPTAFMPTHTDDPRHSPRVVGARALTIVSTIVFNELKSADGDAVSRHHKAELQAPDVGYSRILQLPMQLY